MVGQIPYLLDIDAAAVPADAEPADPAMPVDIEDPDLAAAGLCLARMRERNLMLETPWKYMMKMQINIVDKQSHPSLESDTVGVVLDENAAAHYH